MKIKILATGLTAQEHQRGHWGLSFLIGRDLLFDTFGISSILQKNMAKMGVSPSDIRHVVISHNHWDHISGLWDILLQNKDITVYLCPDSDDSLKQKITNFGGRIVEARGLVSIEEHIFTTGKIEGKYNGLRISEQALVVQCSRGLTVVTGCAHPGIVQILGRVKEQFDEDLFLVMGGFHLLDRGEEKIYEVIEQLKSRGVRKVAPTHCTGDLATELLREAYGENFIDLHEGSFVEIPDSGKV